MADADRPNIVVFWGDDIGISNLSCYSDGIMGYRTPNIDRLADEGDPVHRFLRGAELHRRPIGVHHRPERLPHRSEQGRDAELADRDLRRGSHHRGAPQAPRLRNGAVRQEPLRRPRRAPADEPRLRRVLRQPLSPERRGGAGVVRTTRTRPTSRTSASATAHAASSSAVSRRAASTRSRTPAR